MKTQFLQINHLCFLLPTYFLMLFSSCDSASHGSKSTEDTIPPDMHTSQIALDYHDTYTGILPCASCEGIETELVLKEDGTFMKKWSYSGKDDPTVHEQSGDYLWHANGQVITLAGLDEGHMYFVGENHLRQLDADGNEITGNLADQYFLKKKIDSR